MRGSLFAYFSVHTFHKKYITGAGCTPLPWRIRYTSSADIAIGLETWKLELSHCAQTGISRSRFCAAGSRGARVSIQYFIILDASELSFGLWTLWHTNTVWKTKYFSVCQIAPSFLLVQLFVCLSHHIRNPNLGSSSKIWRGRGQHSGLSRQTKPKESALPLLCLWYPHDTILELFIPYGTRYKKIKR